MAGIQAILAAEDAPAFRKYWDKPDFASSRDPPFKWNDIAGHAFLAAKNAPDFRKRWDDPNFTSSKDPKFKWYDAAAVSSAFVLQYFLNTLPFI